MCSIILNREAFMKLSEIRVVVFIAQEFEDLEFWVPVMRLREEGAEVIVAGDKAGETYRGKGGLVAKSDVSFDEVLADNYDAFLIPGGWAPDKLRRYHSVTRLIQKANNLNKIIGMICHAGLVGISAGIVAGKPATGSLGIKDDLINAGAEWRDIPALRSGNLVWGRVVPDIPDYCRELVTALSERK
jgi:protease I